MRNGGETSKGSTKDYRDYRDCWPLTVHCTARDVKSEHTHTTHTTPHCSLHRLSRDVKREHILKNF